MGPWNTTATVQLLTHSNTTKSAHRSHAHPGMKMVRTELREGRNVFLWQGGAYLNPKEFVKDTSHF